jgi:hypothetical protein
VNAEDIWGLPSNEKIHSITGIISRVYQQECPEGKAWKRQRIFFQTSKGELQATIWGESGSIIGPISEGTEITFTGGITISDYNEKRQLNIQTQMKLNEAFPSPYLKAEDLNGKTVTVVIASAGIERLGQGKDAQDKLVISFSGKAKKMVCNKTNANMIAYLHGDDTDHWIGKAITIESRPVEFQGNIKPALRVVGKAPQVAAPTPPPPPVMPTTEDGLDVPF